MITTDMTYIAEYRPHSHKALIGMESEGIIREITGMKRNMPYPSDGILEIISRDDGRLFDMFWDPHTTM